MEPQRPPSSLAGYIPDPATSQRLGDYLKNAPPYIQRYIVGPDGRIIPNPDLEQKQGRTPGDVSPSTDPGLGSLREYSRQGEGYARP